MIKGTRPSIHMRNVPSRTGRNPTLINPDVRKKEKWIHRQLRKFKVRGEWFKLNEIQFKQVFKDSLHSRKIDKQMLSFFSHG